MPGNIVQINHAEELEWYVGDSKMDELIKCLDEIGFRASEDDAISSDVSSSGYLPERCPISP